MRNGSLQKMSEFGTFCKIVTNFIKFRQLLRDFASFSCFRQNLSLSCSTAIFAGFLTVLARKHCMRLKPKVF